MRINGVSLPPTKKIVAPQNGNSHLATIHVYAPATGRLQHSQLANQDSTTSAPYSAFQAFRVR
jgi:hypothetical protein